MAGYYLAPAGQGQVGSQGLGGQGAALLQQEDSGVPQVRSGLLLTWSTDLPPGEHPSSPLLVDTRRTRPHMPLTRTSRSRQLVERETRLVPLWSLRLKRRSGIALMATSAGSARVFQVDA